MPPRQATTARARALVRTGVGVGTCLIKPARSRVFPILFCGLCSSVRPRSQDFAQPPRPRPAGCAQLVHPYVKRARAFAVWLHDREDKGCDPRSCPPRPRKAPRGGVALGRRAGHKGCDPRQTGPIGDSARPTAAIFAPERGGQKWPSKAKKAIAAHTRTRTDTLSAERVPMCTCRGARMCPRPS